MNRIKHKITFTVSVILTILLTGFIFEGSMQTGEESGSLSDMVAEFVQRLFSPIGIELEFLPLARFIRKLAHFSEYALLAMCFSTAVASVTDNMSLYLTSLPYSVAIASLDEFAVQASTEGRAPMLTDVLIDSAGALFGALFVIFVVHLIKTKCSRN